MKKRLLLVLITLNLLFIWGNSALPSHVSQAVSDAVGDVVEEIVEAILPGEQEPALSGGSGLLRKLAHFSEFASLGFLTAWFWHACGERRRHLFALTLLGCLLAACIDETIQLMNPGRGPSLLDVWLDTSGALTGAAMLLVKNMAFGGNRQRKNGCGVSDTMGPFPDKPADP